MMALRTELARFDNTAMVIEGTGISVHYWVKV